MLDILLTLYPPGWLPMKAVAFSQPAVLLLEISSNASSVLPLSNFTLSFDDVWCWSSLIWYQKLKHIFSQTQIVSQMNSHIPPPLCAGTPPSISNWGKACYLIWHPKAARLLTEYVKMASEDKPDSCFPSICMTCPVKTNVQWKHKKCRASAIKQLSLTAWSCNIIIMILLCIKHI